MDGLVQRVLTTGGQPTDIQPADAPAADGGTPCRDNKHMQAQNANADGQLATATSVANTPAVGSAEGGYVGVAVNGQLQFVGNGTLLADCYFSGDGGVTPRAFQDIVAGDLLYWNPSFAGFDLEHDGDGVVGDRIDFLYNVTV